MLLLTFTETQILQQPPLRHGLPKGTIAERCNTVTMDIISLWRRACYDEKGSAPTVPVDLRLLTAQELVVNPVANFIWGASHEAHFS